MTNTTSAKELLGILIYRDKSRIATDCQRVEDLVDSPELNQGIVA
jgi:hypothetical protein